MKTACVFAFIAILLSWSPAIPAHTRNRKRDPIKRYQIKRAEVSEWKELEPAEEIHSDRGIGAKMGRVTLHRTTNHIRSLHEWKDFKEKHQKAYSTVEEERRRYGFFVQNKLKIEQHNREHALGRHSFDTSLNEFADMSHEEFVRTLNGFKRRYGDSLAKPYASTFLEPHNTKLPEQVDWRTHGYVTPVKNQGHCGSCWSFSATGALEGQHKRKNGTLVSLSEQNLVDCSGPFGNQGCNGGLMDQAFQYIKANDGIDTEASYPYEAKDDRCRYVKANAGADDTGFVDIPTGNERKLQMAVGTVGPVSVAIDASHSSFQFYNSSIYFEPNCNASQLDHGVLVVGYGVNEDGVEYWLVKNSWGTTWGEQGYIKMARNRDNMCGIATSASYPLV